MQNTLNERIEKVVSDAKCTHGGIAPHYICRECADAIREAAQDCDHTSESESTWANMAASINDTTRRLGITRR